MSRIQRSEQPGITIHQARGQKTYNALVQTAFKLLEDEDFENISVAALARAAGYSVGAFYSRFNSKDQFFDALVTEYLNERNESRIKILSRYRGRIMLEKVISETVQYYWSKRRFWQAALKRHMKDPEFWQPMRELASTLATGIIESIERDRQRPLDQDQETHVRFAVQIMMGTINNAIIRRPGPIFPEQQEFTDQLTRAFLLVSDYDALIAPRA